MLVWVQVGQSGHPRPDPVRRTAAPEMIVRARADTAAAATVWNRLGETRADRHRRPLARLSPLAGPSRMASMVGLAPGELTSTDPGTVALLGMSLLP